MAAFSVGLTEQIDYMAAGRRPLMSGYPRIPYGVANFRRIRLEHRLYVDKTRFLHALEQVDHAVLIRPRRFGKTCWVSVLEHYYDRAWAHEFDAVFGGTDVGRRPTEHRHRYVVLRFNFSAFKTALEGLEHHFEEYCQLRLRTALERNPDLFPEAAVRRIRAPASVNGQLNELFAFAGERGIPLYALIDEYDNFANTVLAHHGEAAYQRFTHGGGFYRNFFATLKTGTEAGSGGWSACSSPASRPSPWTTSPAASTSAGTSACGRSSTTCWGSPRTRCGACWSCIGITGCSIRTRTPPGT